MSRKASVLAAPDATLTPITTLIGAKVVGSDQVVIGTVAEVMMAAAAGHIVYVALSVGGIAGFGERLFAVPWGAFVVDPVGGAVSVRFDGATLADLEGFNKDTWPTVADDRFLTL